MEVFEYKCCFVSRGSSEETRGYTATLGTLIEFLIQSTSYSFLIDIDDNGFESFFFAYFRDCGVSETSRRVFDE